MTLRFSSSIYVTLCVSLLCGGSAFQNTLAQGKTQITPTGTPNFTSKAGGFSIYFPAQPQPVPVRAGVRYRCKIGTVSYAIDSGNGSPLPQAPRAALDRASTKMFDRVQNSWVGKMNGKLQSSQDVVLMGFPGRRFTATAREGQVVAHFGVFFTPGHSYILLVMGSKKDCLAQRASIQKFLVSFRPLPK